MIEKNSDIETVKQLNAARQKIEQEISKVIVGQKEVIEQILVCLLANGHGLIIGVPGLAKTLMVNTLARVLNLAFNRVQFTPDLMPSDITGTEILEENKSPEHREFKFVKGPVFANIVLADEINRTPPRRKRLSCRRCRKWRDGGRGDRRITLSHSLCWRPKTRSSGRDLSVAGSQLDRFMFNIFVDYPNAKEEEEIVRSTTSAYEPKLDTGYQR